MTSRRTGAAVLSLFKLNREFPLAERYFFGDQLGQYAAMNCMAYYAVPTFFPLVHMEIMEVPVTVPEAGSKGSLGVEKEISLVAKKTEGILSVSVWHVHVSWELLDQKLCVSRPVWIMTRSAFAFFNRTMKHCILFSEHLWVACQ